MKIIYISILLLLLAGCGSDDANNSSAKSPDANDSIVKETIISEGSIVNPEANVLEGRYSTPEGYNRVEVSGDSFGEFLRNSKLKPYGEKVLYYDGREKNRQNVYDSVFDECLKYGIQPLVTISHYETPYNLAKK